MSKRLFEILMQGRANGVELEIVEGLGGELVVRLAQSVPDYRAQGTQSPREYGQFGDNFEEDGQVPGYVAPDAGDGPSDPLRRRRGGKLKPGRQDARALSLKSAVTEAVIAMRQSGTSITDIAHQQRVSLSTVRRILDDAGLTRKQG